MLGIVPCVIGLDVRNGSGEHSVFGSRDGARCEARLCQRAVFGLRDCGWILGIALVSKSL